MRRVESIDARLWQGAGILLVVSVGAISFIGWNPPNTKADLIFVLGAGLFSILVLIVWWFLFHRWIHLQRIYSYRAREIEEALDLRLNRYARLFEYWKTDTVVDLSKREFRERDPSAYDNFQRFWEKESKRYFSRVTIQWCLRLLTGILILAWVGFIVIHVAD